MAVLGFCCCVGISLDAESQGSSLVAVFRLLIAVASLGQASGCGGAQALGHAGLVAAAGGLSSCGSGLLHGLVALGQVGSSRITDQTCVFFTDRRILYH